MGKVLILMSLLLTYSTFTWAGGFCSETTTLIPYLSQTISSVTQQNRFFGYYFSNNSIPEIKNHVNVIHLWAHFKDAQKSRNLIFSILDVAKLSGLSAIVDVPSFLFKDNIAPIDDPEDPDDDALGRDLSLRNDAESLWADFVEDLVSYGYLDPSNNASSTVAAFYVIDEPSTRHLRDKNNGPHPDLQRAVDIIKSHQLSANIPIVTTVIGIGRSVRHGARLFDWVGTDFYHVSTKKYLKIVDRLAKKLRPEQKIILIPQAAKGGALDKYPHDPKRIETYFLEHNSIIGIMPFLWHSFENTVGLKYDPELRRQYEKIGNTIKSGNCVYSGYNCAFGCGNL